MISVRGGAAHIGEGEVRVGLVGWLVGCLARMVDATCCLVGQQGSRPKRWAVGGWNLFGGKSSRTMVVVGDPKTVWGVTDWEVRWQQNFAAGIAGSWMTEESGADSVESCSDVLDGWGLKQSPQD